ncbi:hypothetical protein WKH82_18005 [Acinetobacter baumannii]|nr:hypothetical protein [Acinetobacter baumannii]
MPYLTDDQIQQYKERYELIEVEYNDLVVRTEKTFKVSLVCLFLGIFFFPMLIIGAIFYLLYLWGKGKTKEYADEMNEIIRTVKAGVPPDHPILTP